MNTYAFNNIDILKSLNDNDKFSFMGYDLIKDKKIDDKNMFEYGLYFTFHEIFTLIDNGTKDRDEILADINNSIDNLYENEYFLNIIDENDNIKEMMDEVCTKVDILTEKYLHKSFCRYMTEEIYRQCITHIKSIIYPNRYVVVNNDTDDDTDDDFIKENGEDDNSKED